ncbi:hypothetical protein [Spiroplasma tabanidicola]|uniref:Uncharacterized protein n=1 Tax=Spiroplasma tabanidicola TaxID=324079 RepID=A0A6I6C8M0_9MOLU|nr:hypothetical protein [Spiroplasma tabanidicola]QGS52016.1 hypothetical protein STABA_v1c06550 [Spiroplasma tabanidicola]
MEKDKKEDEKVAIVETIDKQTLYNEIKNNKIANEQSEKFVRAIFENYFLDNDNINFLQKNGYNFFSFFDDELCFCLSEKKYEDCCKLKLINIVDKTYKTYEEILHKPEEYEKYLLSTFESFKNTFLKLAKLEKCNYPNCSEYANENRLYEINFDKKNLLSTNRLNPFDNIFKMGEDFFKKVSNENFKFYGLCNNHFNELRLITINSKTSDQEIIKIHIIALLYKTFIGKVQLECLKEEFRKYFNSISDEDYKALFVFRIKKLSSLVKSLLENLKIYKTNFLENKDLKIIKLELETNKNMKLFDLMYPQVCPEDFSLVNSINNIFVPERVATINIANTDEISLTTIVYNKKDERLEKFFNQYLKILENKEKFIEAFVSNCALILSDNILFDKSFYDKLENENKLLYSALNKFRFENPNMGQEYLKMKFFAGFNKGNNFF